MLNFLRLNWGIYESDILFLEGKVEYTGKVIAKSYRSTLEEAVVTVRGASCVVYMERFRGGNAVICNFVKDGTPVAQIEEYRDADVFMDIYDAMSAINPAFLEYSFVRRIKQHVTFILQMVCIGIILYCVYYGITHFVSVGVLGVALSSLVLFLLLGCFYSGFRLAEPSKYVPKFLDDDTNNSI